MVKTEEIENALKSLKAVFKTDPLRFTQRQRDYIYDAYALLKRAINVEGD